MIKKENISYSKRRRTNECNREKNDCPLCIVLFDVEKLASSLLPVVPNKKNICVFVYPKAGDSVLFPLNKKLKHHRRCVEESILYVKCR